MLDFEEFQQQVEIIFFGSYIPPQCKNDLIRWARKLQQEEQYRSCKIVEDLEDPPNMPNLPTDRSGTSAYIYEKSIYYVEYAPIAVFFKRDQCNPSETLGLELQRRIDASNNLSRSILVLERHYNRRKDPTGIEGAFRRYQLPVVFTKVEPDVYNLLKGQLRELVYEWYIS